MWFALQDFWKQGSRAQLEEQESAAKGVCVCNLWSHNIPVGVFLSIFKQGATESLHGCRQRSSMQLTRISRLITVTYLQIVMFVTTIPF